MRVHTWDEAKNDKVHSEQIDWRLCGQDVALPEQYHNTQFVPESVDWKGVGRFYWKPRVVAEGKKHNFESEQNHRAKTQKQNRLTSKIRYYCFCVINIFTLTTYFVRKG